MVPASSESMARHVTGKRKRKNGKSFTNVCALIRLVFVTLIESFLVNGSGSSVQPWPTTLNVQSLFDFI